MKDFFIPSPKKGESRSSKPSFPFPLLFCLLFLVMTNFYRPVLRISCGTNIEISV
jgi:hypothetical protein